MKVITKLIEEPNMSFSQKYLVALQHQMEVKTIYIQELEDLKNSPSFLETVEYQEFLKMFAQLIKKHFPLDQKDSVLFDPILNQASKDLLDNWIKPMDKFIYQRFILYSEAFNSILDHIECLKITPSGKDLSIQCNEKLEELNLLLKNYEQANEQISKVSGPKFYEFFDSHYDPSLKQLLDHISYMTQFILVNISSLKQKWMIDTILKTINAFDKTVFDYTSEDSNREYLESNYEILKILLFLANHTDCINDI